jgi:hypothetical protein
MFDPVSEGVTSFLKLSHLSLLTKAEWAPGLSARLGWALRHSGKSSFRVFDRILAEVAF